MNKGEKKKEKKKKRKGLEEEYLARWNNKIWRSEEQNEVEL